VRASPDVYGPTTNSIVESAALAAEEDARDIVAGWHGKDKNDKDKYKWNTYRAIRRRNGFFKEHNWNQALTRPLEDRLVIPWTKCFTGENSTLATCLDVFLQICIKAFEDCGDLILETVQTLGSDSSSMLRQQLEASVQAITLLHGQALNEITLKQRELNRLTTPSIENSMLKVYKKITKEKGPGSFARSKDHMVKHIETSRTA